ncbi:MAG: CPBP family intramembrane metalloprotease [Cyclobacteriaceae bacterium]|nr:CPBP family intramembrane metalloprotease [Cyclobacteriaceae bacterium]
MQIIEYLKNPTVRNHNQFSQLEKIKKTLSIFLLYVAIALIAGIFLRIIDSLIFYFSDFSIYEQLKVTNSESINRFGNYSFIIVVILGPLYEEILFRLPLNLSKLSIGVSLGFMFFYLLTGNLLSIDYQKFDTYFKIVGSIFFAGLVTFFFPKKFLDLFKNNFKLVFFIHAVIFALLHLTNFDSYNSSVILIYPLFTLPQLIMAVLIGYTRIEIGFAYCVLLHSLINLLSFAVN